MYSMSLEETEPPNETLDDVLGWLEDSSMSLTPLPGFNDSDLLNEFDGSQTWEWNQIQDPGYDILHSYSQDLNAYMGCESPNLEVVTGVPVTDSDPPPLLPEPNDQSKKRNHDVLTDDQLVKRSAGSKKQPNKSSETSCKDGNKEYDGSQTWEWDQTQDPGYDFLESYSQDLNAYMSCEAPNLEVVTGIPVIDSDPPPVVLQEPNVQSKKRNRDGLIDAHPVKRSGRSKKRANKSSEMTSKDNNKEERWAEQLLNPCALAITARNTSRVQHYLCVLSELASSCGDSNRRLAAFGLHALQNHISTSSVSSSITFASAEVKMFQKTLLKFYEVSPWFALPNNMANSAILQIIAQEPEDKKDLHILDVGVSHGMQWPTLLEALCSRPEGPPLHVRITVVSDLTTDIPFSVGPPSYNYGSQLIAFARSLNINLQISVIDKFQVIDTSPHETLIVCTQFRLYQLKHSIPEALKALRSLNPKGVVLCENNGEYSSSSGDFAAGFSRKLDYLWKFLDSTSYGFKEDNREERKLMEGEAAKVLMSSGETNEVKDIWYERMRNAGFVADAFGEDAIDGAKSLLRKYDNNWEIRMEDGDTFAGLLWKGEAVSFCSLWKLASVF